MGQTYSDIAAVCISSLTLYVFFSRGRISALQTRLFSILLYATISASLMGIIRTIIYSVFASLSVYIQYPINVLYFCIMNSLPPILAIFILNLASTGVPYKNILFSLFPIPWAVLILAILSSPITGFMFSFSAEGVYRRGPGYPLFYAMTLFYTAFIIYYLFAYKDRYSQTIRKSVYVFMPFSLFPAFIHLADPVLRMQTLGMAISELIMLMTFLDSSPMIDEESNLLNRDGFLGQMDLFRRENRSFTAFLVFIDTIDFIRHGLGSEAFTKLQMELCFSLFGFPRNDRFAAHIGTGSFIHILANQKDAERQIGKLQKIFNTTWRKNGADIRMSARLCKIRYPEDTNDTDVILRSMYRLSRRWQLYPAQKLLSFEELVESDPGRFLDIQNAIRRGFLNRGFELYYQPIVSATTGTLVSAEALIRLQDTSLGWVSPAEFIPAAEQSGSIHRIGDWVIETACMFLARLKKECIELMDLEINLSSMQCVQSNILQKLHTITAQHGVDHTKLCLEITETAAGYSKSQLKKNMEALSQAGYPIAIDDFGTGFANLANLLTINFTKVKFDKSLIDTLSEPDSRTIGLEYLVSLFKSIGTTMIAEGVETKAQADQVKSLGIDLIQGYYYSRPLTADAFIAYIRSGDHQCI